MIESPQLLARRERILAEAEARLPELLADLQALVECESPSSDRPALERCADVLAGIIGARLGSGPTRGRDEHGAPLLTWSAGAGGRVLLVGHLDTVWPIGTLERLPFAISDDLIRGPGTFDMKAGLVIAIHALVALRATSGEEALDGVTLLANSDEELGSPGSRAAIEDLARGAVAVLVFEGGGSDGEVTIARKGLANYRVVVTGRAAHAGVEPQKGINAAVAASSFLLAAARIADPGAGTTVTPTLVRAGSARNTVPAAAEIAIDVRAEDPAEQERVHRELLALAADGDEGGAALRVVGEPHRLVMTSSASAPLYALVVQEADALGLGPLGARSTGGGSDANLTAAMGVPSLDGLGAIGGGAHADDEHVTVSGLRARLALVVAMLERLVSDELPSPFEPITHS